MQFATSMIDLEGIMLSDVSEKRGTDREWLIGKTK